jgi:hypothetical protein
VGNVLSVLSAFPSSIGRGSAPVSLQRGSYPRKRDVGRRIDLHFISTASAVALQRCDRSVTRTMNWLYDHLRFIPGYTPIVLCDELLNRDEFPELEDKCIYHERFTRRV